MKTIKAKYYEETKEIVPLDPQPLRVKGEWKLERVGTDEKGEYCIIDFMVEGDTYFDYDAGKQNTTQPLEVTITEEEWNKPANNTETIDTQKFLDALAEVATSPKSAITNTETNQQISLTDTEKLIPTIGQRFLNACYAIKSIFQP